MSRLIKFRGKSWEDGQWCYATPEDESWQQFWVMVDRQTVGQFTGLIDKYSKEIFEGDIVKGHNAWDNEGDRVQVVRYEGGTWNYSYAIHEYAEHPEREWEVVGNIYETPELLEVRG